jgi:UDP-glucose:(heptosyl)LPS alpha-1,3-glucosyltransferase
MKIRRKRHPLYKRWDRYKHFADYERAVFAPGRRPRFDIEVQQPLFIKALPHPLQRFHLLPPGIAEEPPRAVPRVRANFAPVQAGGG